jgi:hypothetical protein
MTEFANAAKARSVAAGDELRLNAPLVMRDPALLYDVRQLVRDQLPTLEAVGIVSTRAED